MHDGGFQLSITLPSYSGPWYHIILRIISHLPVAQYSASENFLLMEIATGQSELAYVIVFEAWH